MGDITSWFRLLKLREKGLPQIRYNQVIWMSKDHDFCIPIGTV
jgi:hypothetical protein